MERRDADGLVQTLSVRGMDEPRQAVHHAFGGPEQPQSTDGCFALREFMDRFFADGDGSDWKLDPVSASRMPPMTLL